MGEAAHTFLGEMYQRYMSVAPLQESLVSMLLPTAPLGVGVGGVDGGDTPKHTSRKHIGGGDGLERYPVISALISTALWLALHI